MKRIPWLAVALVAFCVEAQEWPSKPVRILVPFPPGGAADAMPRIMADKLAAKWNQPFVVENRAGATGAIAGELLSRAAPDGHTFMSTPPAPLVINPSLYAKLPYDPTQFVPVSVMASIPSVLLVHPKVGAAGVPGFISVAWFGIVAPPKTPAAIAEKLSASINEILKMPDVQKRLTDLSAEPIGMGPAQMARFMKEDAQRWREAINTAGLKPGAL